MWKILSEDEIRLMTRGLRKAIGPALGELSGQYGLDIEDSVRFGAVATRVREAREGRGMDLKAAAKALRVPQYRLRDIEKCSLRHLRGSDLHAYIDFLGLTKWFARWRKATQKLAARLTPKPKVKELKHDSGEKRRAWDGSKT
jgi:hypothetical protein